VTRRKAAPGRDKLIETARTLFAVARFDGVSTKQLVSEAGLSIGALYLHFPTKEAAYRTAVEWGLNCIPEQAGRISPAMPWPWLEGEVVLFCSVITASTVESQLLWLEPLGTQLDTRLSDLQPLAASFERFQALLGQLAPEADAELMLKAIVSLAFGFLQLGGLRRQVPSLAARLHGPGYIAWMVERSIFVSEAAP